MSESEQQSSRPARKGPRTPPAPPSGPRTPPPLSGPRTPVGPKTPPEPAFYSPASEDAAMSERRYSKPRYHGDRSPEMDRRYSDRDRRRSDTPEGQDARGLTPEPSERRRDRDRERERERSPPNNGTKRRRDSDWEATDPKRRKSRDRSRDRKRDRRSRDRSPYRDRTPTRSDHVVLLVVGTKFCIQISFHQ